MIESNSKYYNYKWSDLKRLVNDMIIKIRQMPEGEEKEELKKELYEANYVADLIEG